MICKDRQDTLRKGFCRFFVLLDDVQDFREVDSHIVDLKGFPEEINIGYGSADPEPLVFKLAIIDDGNPLPPVQGGEGIQNQIIHVYASLLGQSHL